MSRLMHRRHWMRLALAQAAGALVPGVVARSAWAQSAETFDFDPFKLGIASGHPGADSVVLWTRLLPVNPLRNPWSDRALAVRWQVALDDRFQQLVQSGETLAPPELAHSVHLEVTGLQPGQTYFYRFIAGGVTSPVGRTRTLPAKGAATERLRMAFASCQRFHSGPFSAYRHMLADAPDLVLFLGDYIYEMGASTSEARGSWAYPANKLSDYRDLYELARSDPALQAMHAACPWLVTWDDHEVLNDYAGGDVRAGLESGRLARHMAMGYQAWYEHMPVSPSVLSGSGQAFSPDRALQIYRSYAWGNLANLHVLDIRQYRSKQVRCGTAGIFDPGNCPDLQNPQRSMLGPSQEAWLLQQLRNAGRDAAGSDGAGRHDGTAAAWNFICQPLVFSRFLLPVSGGLANHDNWDGYPVSRQRILQTLMDAKTRNPVVLGGDIHQNWAAHVHADPAQVQGPVVMPEFVATSISTASFGPMSAQEMQAIAPHCLYTDRHRRGYGLIELSPQSLRVDFRVVDDIRRADSQVGSAATFLVQAGSPLIQVQQMEGPRP